MEIMHLFFTPDEDLYDKRITDYQRRGAVPNWMYWRTMFAFENWHSALEMKLYIKRFIHHVGGLPDSTALRFTHRSVRVDDSADDTLPRVIWSTVSLSDKKVVNVEFTFHDNKKQASRLILLRDGEEDAIDLTENDLVFITNGGCVENSTLGSQSEPAPFRTEIKEGGGWDMWRKIAAQDSSFTSGTSSAMTPNRPAGVSATVTTLDDKIPPTSRKSAGADPPGQGGHRRHRNRQRLELAQLDLQSPAPVPFPAQRPAGRLDIRPLHRQTR